MIKNFIIRLPNAIRAFTNVIRGTHDSELAALRHIYAVSSKVCGQSNCNCPGADKVKKAVGNYNELNGIAETKLGKR